MSTAVLYLKEPNLVIMSLKPFDCARRGLAQHGNARTEAMCPISYEATAGACRENACRALIDAVVAVAAMHARDGAGPPRSVFNQFR